MRYIALSIYSFLSFFAWADSQYHHSQLLSLYPHEARSRKEEIVINYIYTALDQRGIEYTLEDRSRASTHSFSKNIYVSIAGNSPDIFTLVVPINKSSVSSALGLGLIEHYHTHVPPIGLRFVFLVDEEIEGNYTGVGAGYFLSHSSNRDTVGVLHIALQENSQTFSLDIGAGGYLTPAWMLKNVKDSLSAETPSLYLPPLYATIIRNQSISRVYQPETLPIIMMKAGIPALSIISATTSTSISIDSYQELIHNIINTIRHPKEVWSSNYIILPWIHNNIIVDEVVVLASTLILIVLIITRIMYLTRNTYLRYTNLIVRYWWHIPVVIASLYLSLILPVYLFKTVSVAHPISDIWKYHQISFFFSHILLSYLLFVLTYQLVIKRLQIPTGRFYSVAALISGMGATILISSINLSYVLPAIWITLGILFCVSARTIRVKVLFFIMTLMFPTLLLGIFIIQSISINALHLYSPYTTSIYMATLICPIYYLIMRLSRLYITKYSPRLGVAIPFVALSVMGVYTITHDPFRQISQPLFVHEEINETKHALNISSPAPFQRVSLLYGQEELYLETTKKEHVVMATPEYPIEIEYFSYSLEEGLFHSFELYSEHEITHIYIDIVPSDSSFQIQNASYPVTFTSEVYQMHIGYRPPLPIEIEFYTNAVNFSVTVTVVFKDTIIPLGLAPDGSMSLVTSSTLEKTMHISVDENGGKIST